jgi:hypothetical protein
MSTLVPAPMKIPADAKHAHCASRQGAMPRAALADAWIDRIASALRERGAVEPPDAKSHDAKSHDAKSHDAKSHDAKSHDAKSHDAKSHQHAQRPERYTTPE